MALAAAGGGHLTVLTVNDPLLEAAAAAAGRAHTVRDQVEAALFEILSGIPPTAPPVIPAIDVVTGDAAAGDPARRHAGAAPTSS